jgi:hypothetical protein
MAAGTTTSIQSHIMRIIWCHLHIVSSLTRMLMAKTLSYQTTMSIYSGRAIMIGNECRIIRRVHENQNCNNHDGLVRYEVQFSGHTYQHHQFMLIYATECGIGHTSYEYIFSNLRSTTARSNMTRECVNPDEHCDGDHCFHRLMLISNSIYFCFLMNHATNQCLSVSRKKAMDWNYTLAQCEYVCGN